MNSINWAFIPPLAELDDESCPACVELWKDSSTQTLHSWRMTQTAREIWNDHRDCHGWNHCECNCCGPCPYCGFCFDGDDWEEE